MKPTSQKDDELWKKAAIRWRMFAMRANVRKRLIIENMVLSNERWTCNYCGQTWAMPNTQHLMTCPKSAHRLLQLIAEEEKNEEPG